MTMSYYSTLVRMAYIRCPERSDSNSYEQTEMLICAAWNAYWFSLDGKLYIYYKISKIITTKLKSTTIESVDPN